MTLSWYGTIARILILIKCNISEARKQSIGLLPSGRCEFVVYLLVLMVLEKICKFKLKMYYGFLSKRDESLANRDLVCKKVPLPNEVPINGRHRTPMNS